MKALKLLFVLTLCIFGLFLTSCQKEAMEEMNIQKQIKTEYQAELYSKEIKTDKGISKVKTKVLINKIGIDEVTHLEDIRHNRFDFDREKLRLLILFYREKVKEFKNN